MEPVSCTLFKINRETTTQNLLFESLIGVRSKTGKVDIKAWLILRYD